MAVYTQLSRSELEGFLADYDLGSLVDFKGIDGGIENTNYFVTLEHQGSQQEYVLTLFEELTQDEMPFFAELTQWLATRKIPVPAPFKDRFGIALKRLKDRPALLQPKFSGRHLAPDELKPEHCAQIGAALGRMHRAGEDFYLTRQAHRGVFWWRRESQRIASRLPEADAELLKAAVADFDNLREQPWGLPMGIIHGDLFHDNALFDGDQLSAILDVYNAASAFMLFDLAIVANDWCANEDMSIDPQREQALLHAYAEERAFEPDEYTAWPTMTQTAAMRFWLSRLLPALGEEPGDKVIKDPEPLKQMLLYRRQHPAQLP